MSLEENFKFLKMEYLSQLHDQLTELEDTILKMNSTDSDEFKNFLRVIHSIKGAAGTYGHQNISTYCHQIEDYVENIFHKSLSLEDYKDDFLKFNDSLKTYVELLQKENGDEKKVIFELAEIYLTNENLKTKEEDIKDPLPLKVLVVDPGQVIYKKLAILKNFNFYISHIDDAYKALGRLLTDNFDLIITTRETGAIDGTRLIKMAKAGNLIPNTSTIFISSSDEYLEHSKSYFNVSIKKDPQFFENLKKEIIKIIEKRKSGPLKTTIKKILYVDDDKNIQNIVKLSLSKMEGLQEIKCVESGMAALEVLKSNFNPDLILLDYQMPEMDGIQTIQEIKKIKECQSIPVIILSGEEQKQGFFVSKGAIGQILKPFNHKNLITSVQNLLKK